MAVVTFWRIGWRYLTRHPWQSALMVVGITLGVAVAVAVDLANVSASRAFDLSTETIAGRASHILVGGPDGLDQSIYVDLEREDLPYPLAPIIAEYVSSEKLGGGLMQLLGVDPFAEAPFRNYLQIQSNGDASILGDLIGFLTQPGSGFISTYTAERYKVKMGEKIEINIGGRTAEIQIIGLINPNDNLSRRALDNLILVDIATAQELTGRLGKLDRVDVILPEKNLQAAIELLESRLPSNTRLLPVDARSGTVQQMTDAFRVNLTALSLLALVVGLFLIYNTITFSVVQRRVLFGTLRCLGVTRREIFFLVVFEAFLVGVIGAGLGLILGVLMGQGAVRIVTRTINDLFFVLNIQGVQIPTSSLLKGTLLGIFATVIAASPPAWEAASVPPRAALSRSGLERKAQKAVSFAALVGIVVLVCGTGILFIPSKNLWVSFLGTFAVIAGFAMLAPMASKLFSRVIYPVAGRVWGALGQMALRNVANSLSRTSVAVAALMVAVSVTIGVSLMVESFRYTVKIWLDQVLQGDIYISAPSLIATQTSASIDQSILEVLEEWPGIKKVFTLRAVTVDSPSGPVQINASSNTHVGEERLYLSQTFPAEQMEKRMLDGAVVVSEPFANRLDLSYRNDSIELYTDRGLKSFPVIGIYYDYASTQGTILMAQSVYHQYWDDNSITAISLKLEDGLNADEVSRDLRDEFGASQRLAVRPNLNLRNEVFEVFNRTFAITQALQLLATVVAFIGVLSALLSLELERQRELGILRAIGLTTRQLWSMIMIETGTLGLTAGILAMPTGYFLALILIYIINRRSFGWTLQLQLAPYPFIQAFFLAVLAALLAGIYPAWRMSKMVTLEAMRYD